MKGVISEKGIIFYTIEKYPLKKAQMMTDKQYRCCKPQQSIA